MLRNETETVKGHLAADHTRHQGPPGAAVFQVCEGRVATHLTAQASDLSLCLSGRFVWGISGFRFH